MRRGDVDPIRSRRGTRSYSSIGATLAVAHSLVVAQADGLVIHIAVVTVVPVEILARLG